MTLEDQIFGHLQRYFAVHAASTYQGPPLVPTLPDFTVAEFDPGPRIEFPVYATLGLSRLASDEQEAIELVLVAPDSDMVHVETLAALASFVATGKDYGEGTCFNIGRGWVNGSQADHAMVSLPYPFGPDLEFACHQDRHCRVLWLLPITRADKEYRIQQGQEALEQAFDAAGLRYWEPHRASVI